MYNLENDYEIRIYWGDIAYATCSRNKPALGQIHLGGNFQVNM